MAEQYAGIVAPLTSGLTTAVTPQAARILTDMGPGTRQIALGQVLANIQQHPFDLEAPLGANGTETYLGVVPNSINGSVVRASVTASAAVALTATNYVTINIQKRTAGGAAVILATYDQSAAALAAWTPLSLAILVSGLAAGDLITAAVVAHGTGTLVAGLVIAQLEYTAL